MVLLQGEVVIARLTREMLMDRIIDSFRRDHREIETLLRVLEQECGVFHRAEQPDYELLGETIAYFHSFLEHCHHPKEDLVANLVRMRSCLCDDMIDNTIDERGAAAGSLQLLENCLKGILNDEQVLRQSFDDAARDFIRHERRQIEIEERELFPTILSILAPADWATLDMQLRTLSGSPDFHGREERLHARSRWISREALVDQAERNRARSS